MAVFLEIDNYNIDNNHNNRKAGYIESCRVQASENQTDVSILTNALRAPSAEPTPNVSIDQEAMTVPVTKDIDSKREVAWVGL
ncbi:hypothetical protein ANCDUO_05661 [Ancylostoma duodenale]|uniref:Uncharacterized protein n=1 Tax=Ancylostoma duodenale TaxID=51022 RepID=A0A0C2GY57_9BILA|nr:hypothetical protein ANCDUO_05661 [Ancylostoma duodenale]